MRFTSICIGLFLLPMALFGGYSRVSGNWSPDRYAPLFSMQEHYDRGSQNVAAELWEEALCHFMVVLYHFPDSPFYSDALYYSGVCLFHNNEGDLANKQFDRYLAQGGKLKHFEKVFDYKLEIAKAFIEGGKKHIFGLKELPKWASAKNEGLKLLDEIIVALPGKEIAIDALYRKAALLRSRKEYRDSIEVLQTLARRFPKHELAAESYLRISEIYFEQSRIESQNPDLVALAQVNIQRFAKHFPADERIELTRKNLLAMQEVYAQSLYDTGRFYERKKIPSASYIYYWDTILKYPGTQAAAKSEERLAKLGL